MNKDTLDFIGLSMMGLIQDPVIKDMVGAQLVMDTNPDNDMIGLALLSQPNYSNSVLNNGVNKYGI